MKLSYLGPKYTNSEDAALRAAERLGVGTELMMLPSHTAVIGSVASGEADKAVVAYHTSQGLIKENIDGFFEYRLVINGVVPHNILYISS